MASADKQLLMPCVFIWKTLLGGRRTNFKTKCRRLFYLLVFLFLAFIIALFNTPKNTENTEKTVKSAPQKQPATAISAPEVKQTKKEQPALTPPTKQTQQEQPALAQPVQTVKQTVSVDSSEGIVAKRPETSTTNISLADLKFLEGLAVFEDPNTGLRGYVNGDGKIVIKPQFTGAGGFYQGRAVVKNAQELWGYIDKSGNWVLSPQFCMAGRFSEGLAAVYVGGYRTETGDCLGGKWGYITQSGKMAIAPQFEQATYFSKNTKGVAVAKVTLDGYSGYINGNGEWVK